MKKILLIFGLLFVLQAQASGQAPLWVAQYGGPTGNVQFFSGIAKDNDDNIFIAGSQSPIQYIIKYNSLGDSLWSRIYDPNIQEFANGIGADNAGNAYVFGYRENNTGTFDYQLLKYSPSGTLLWVRNYNGLNPTAMDEIEAMTIDANNNIYVTGYSGNGSGSADVVTIKYNSNGDSLWVTRTNDGASETGRSIKVDNSGNVYVSGMRQVGATARTFVVKYNSSGVQQWFRTSYMFPAEKNALVVDNSGNVYIGGTLSNPGTFSDVYILKFNSIGDSLWSRTWNVLSSDRIDGLEAIGIDNQNNLIVLSESNRSGTLSALAKYNTAGNMLWERTYQVGGASTIPHNLKIDGAGNVFVCGGGGSAGFIVKYDTNGDTVWVANYSSGFSGGNNIQDIIISNDIIYGSGRMRSSGTGSIFNIYTLKYSLLPAGMQNNTNISGGYYLKQNYPNPFNPATSITFNIPVPEQVKLSVYNALGEKVSELINGRLSAGQHSVQFDASGLPSGVYYCKLETRGQTQTRKMSLIK